MLRAFVMRVNPEQHAEYTRRHNPIWPELEATLRAHGVRTYSIFLEPSSSQLFAVMDIEDEVRWNAVAQTDVCRRWWAYMRDLMPTHPDNRPISLPLVEVFRLGGLEGIDRG